MVPPLNCSPAVSPHSVLHELWERMACAGLRITIHGPQNIKSLEHKFSKCLSWARTDMSLGDHWSGFTMANRRLHKVLTFPGYRCCSANPSNAFQTLPIRPRTRMAYVDLHSPHVSPRLHASIHWISFKLLHLSQAQHLSCKAHRGAIAP